MSFANYKKTKKDLDLTSLTQKVDALAEGGKKSFKDDRFWKPSVDKAGNGSASLRFLPAPDGEDLPWVQYHEHHFSHNGEYYVELCPTTLDGRKCPVCADNTTLWKTEIKENQDVARLRKRKLSYIANILILKDKEAPENEGKVFLFKFGQKIFEKIKLQLKPKDSEDTPVNVFDFWAGADFRLEIKNVAEYRNYDDSNFRPSAPLYKGDDAKLEAVYNSLYKLQPFVEESKFKPYDDLEKKFKEVYSGAKGKIQKKADELFDGPDDILEKNAQPSNKGSRLPKAESGETAPWENNPTRKPRAKKETKAVEEPAKESEASDDLDYYNQLVED